MDDFDLVNDFDRIFDGGGDYVDVSRRPLGTARREDAEPEGWVAPEKPAPEQKSARGMNSLSEDEKPREKALRQGIDALTDTELLAILLGSGIPGKSVLELSREILRDNDDRLAYLPRKSIPEIVRKYKGIGTAKAALLVAAMTFGARAQTDLQIQDPRIASSQEVYAFMRPRLERLNNEEFWVLHLSRANRLQSVEQVSKGGQSQTTVDVKLIVKSVIDRLSSGIILCHNHPSGNMVPSVADDQLTRRIAEVCKLVDVQVLDHLIIGPTGYYSYRDEGKL